ncbi:uncharacterized protein LOC120682971 [Panicum virgatum]|uniref:uncharacterized protein LOC120682971 n=1 Tax=Panicum virgatum TaxID=38727 RepID=UPI0019D609CC|nr:uncharacterized protein LOC120682971 [Panicum virgatum]
MEDICGSAGSSSHQHDDCALADSSLRQHGDCASAGSSSRQHGDRPYPRWTGARLRSSRSLPGRLSGGAWLGSSRSLPGRLSGWRNPLDMHWPEHLDKIFVDACYEAVEMDITVTEHKSLFWNRIAEFIYKATQLSIIQKDLKSRFKYFRDLWGQYQKLTRELHLHRGSTKPSPEEMKKELESSKFNRMLQYMDKLTYIFVKCDEHKSPSVAAYHCNVRCGNLTNPKELGSSFGSVISKWHDPRGCNTIS